MKSDDVGTTLKHSETINGNVKNLSKRIEMKDKAEFCPNLRWLRIEPVNSVDSGSELNGFKNTDISETLSSTSN